MKSVKVIKSFILSDYPLNAHCFVLYIDTRTSRIVNILGIDRKMRDIRVEKLTLN